MVGDAIDTWAGKINRIFRAVLKIVTSPDAYNEIYDKVPPEIKSAISAVALSLVTLIFLIDFIHKSLDLKWVTWENVLMFFFEGCNR